MTLLKKNFLNLKLSIIDNLCLLIYFICVIWFTSSKNTKSFVHYNLTTIYYNLKLINLLLTQVNVPFNSYLYLETINHDKLSSFVVRTSYVP